MAKLEVRCCCNANKVLGYLDHPGLQKKGDIVSFPILDNTRCPEILVIAGEVHQHNRWIELRLEVDEVCLPIQNAEAMALGDYLRAEPERILAIKNRDYPIEQLRLVRGFEEVNTWPNG